MKKMTRYYSTPDGGSRFQDLEVPDTVSNTLFELSSELVRLSKTPAGTFNDWHYTPFKPMRQVGVIVGGKLEITTTDGEKRVFGVGDIFISDNFEGKGHTTRAVDGPVYTVYVQLPREFDLTRWVAGGR